MSEGLDIEHERRAFIAWHKNRHDGPDDWYAHDKNFNQEWMEDCFEVWLAGAARQRRVDFSQMVAVKPLMYLESE